MAFGHAHHGFTLGLVAGKLVADLMIGEESGLDAVPYGLKRLASVWAQAKKMPAQCAGKWLRFNSITICRKVYG